MSSAAIFCLALLALIIILGVQVPKHITVLCMLQRYKMQVVGYTLTIKGEVGWCDGAG